MNAPMRELPAAGRPTDMGEEEWALRLELAACYRLFAHLGWAEMIFNHITLRVPGAAPQFLINPYGLHYSEVTARNLVKVDLRGNVIGQSAYPINPAGFVIHAAIHEKRADAHCIIHTHTTAGIAVACKAEGLACDNFYSAQFWGRLAYHDFEGVTTDLAEQQRLVASLGNADVLILRNHGLLVVGPSVPEAFIESWSLQRACEVQVAAGSMPGPNRPIDEAVLRAIPAQRKPMQRGHIRPYQPVFDAMLRVAGIRLEDIAGQ
ncbi:MAG: class II aldolase/adducin family protein [Pseudomonadota bacterium]|nr:class II aldolase/adducin family protein [Pseudomonadota bacterium]